PTGRGTYGAAAVHSEALQGFDVELQVCGEAQGESRGSLAHTVSEGGVGHCEALQSSAGEAREESDEARVEASAGAREAQAQALREASAGAREAQAHALHEALQSVLQRVPITASNQQPLQQNEQAVASENGQQYTGVVSNTNWFWAAPLGKEMMQNCSKIVPQAMIVQLINSASRVTEELGEASLHWASG
ncbi:hypothetical protein SOVF_094800, partial [Spinacia oleracea]